MRIRAQFVREGDWWVAWTDDVPGAIVDGVTLAEARGRLVEAVYARWGFRGALEARGTRSVTEELEV
jgi:hypothetical protein